MILDKHFWPEYFFSGGGAAAAAAAEEEEGNKPKQHKATQNNIYIVYMHVCNATFIYSQEKH